MINFQRTANAKIINDTATTIQRWSRRTDAWKNYLSSDAQTVQLKPKKYKGNQPTDGRMDASDSMSTHVKAPGSIVKGKAIIMNANTALKPQG